MARFFQNTEHTFNPNVPMTIGVQAVGPASFANNFFGLASQFLGAQSNITASQSDYLHAAQVNANALAAGSIQTSNQYFFGLANSQTQFLNNIGQQFVGIAGTAAQAQLQAVQRIGKGGILSRLF